MPGPSCSAGTKLEVHVTQGDGTSTSCSATGSSDDHPQQQQQQHHHHHHLQLHGHGLPNDDSMARSPSHESFATDLSLLSLSSSGSDVSRFRIGLMSISRVTSADCEEQVAPLIHVHDAAPTVTTPTSSGRHHHHHHHLLASNRNSLQVPGECYGASRSQDALFEEESDVIRSCSVLSSAVLGLMKSFSTGDISTSFEFTEPLRNTVSEEVLCANAWATFEVPANRRLDCTSRSCSTWVAVGDMQSSTSQLPSPSTRCGSGNIPGFTAADLVRSVNKKVRQMYIRRRLLSTYKALERLTKSQLNLSEALQSSGPSDIKKNIQDELRLMSSAAGSRGQEGHKTPLTQRDVERDRGKPLTKYERNIMIFDWLHNLDDTEMPFEVAAQPPQQQPGSQTLQQAA